MGGGGCGRLLHLDEDLGGGWEWHEHLLESDTCVNPLCGFVLCWWCGGVAFTCLKNEKVVLMRSDSRDFVLEWKLKI